MPSVLSSKVNERSSWHGRRPRRHGLAPLVCLLVGCGALPVGAPFRRIERPAGNAQRLLHAGAIAAHLIVTRERRGIEKATHAEKRIDGRLLTHATSVQGQRQRAARRIATDLQQYRIVAGITRVWEHVRGSIGLVPLPPCQTEQPARRARLARGQRGGPPTVVLGVIAGLGAQRPPARAAGCQQSLGRQRRHRDDPADGIAAVKGGRRATQEFDPVDERGIDEDPPGVGVTAHCEATRGGYAIDFDSHTITAEPAHGDRVEPEAERIVAHAESRLITHEVADIGCKRRLDACLVDHRHGRRHA